MSESPGAVCIGAFLCGPKQARKENYSYILPQHSSLLQSSALFPMMGHVVAARLMGFRTAISYGSTYLIDSPYISKEQDFLFILGGPLQTMLTGTAGLVLMSGQKQQLSGDRPGLAQWLVILIALFWLRQSANFIGFFILYRVITYLPDKLRLTFMAEGLTGGIIGFAAWFGGLGEVFMPLPGLKHVIGRKKKLH
jgi:hypothetical protein